MTFPIDRGNLYAFWSGLDELGLLLGLARLPGEVNADYRARLEDVYAHPGNATYQGLIHSISREFGIPYLPALTIVCPSTPGEAPRVILDNQELSLYLNGQDLAASWFLRDPRMSTLTSLVQAINNTGVFSATINPGINPNSYPAGLLNADSYQWVLKEPVPAAIRFTLAHMPINSGTVSFDEGGVFGNYTNSPSQPGDFHLDTNTGEVSCISLPSGTGGVIYQYRQASLTLNWFPIVISDLNSTQSRNWFFSQVEQNIWNTPEARYNPGVPSTFMRRIIDEINTNCPVLWGT